MPQCNIVRHALKSLPCLPSGINSITNVQIHKIVISEWLQVATLQRGAPAGVLLCLELKGGRVRHQRNV
jgi:hypothetical protein